MRITIVIRGERLLRGFDEDVRAALGEEIAARGVKILPSTQIARIDKTPAGTTSTSQARIRRRGRALVTRQSVR